MEDFIHPKGISSLRSRQDFNNNEISVLDIKAHYHGLKYAQEVIKGAIHQQEIVA